MFSVGLVVEGRVEGCLLNSRKKKKVNQTGGGVNRGQAVSLRASPSQICGERSLLACMPKDYILMCLTKPTLFSLHSSVPGAVLPVPQ